ncbi:substrate-binding domain-containing protein [Pseudarthrobacter cellobiosi]|uniref:substrate-binding domain-containing protein n=1 Tax=Pseudarthrobacter cellobiosi TaxID=2953654 RepID=UPI00208FD361|nr:substrate-binding domain-containing protein [Pseudarthrobacter sp. HLT1-5]MCO4256942.1 substrate-binding domain-containing protein [Pseudarthrobacter sp. HLT1-5]
MIRPLSKRRTVPAVLGILLSLGMVLTGLAPAQAANYLRIGGSGSSWAGNALQDWIARVGAQGVTVDYENKGSSTGRKEFADQMKQFAVSEIPYTGDTADPRDNSMPGFAYGMLPVVAGGTAFMYNLKAGSSRMTSLKLSQPAIAKIFTGQVTRWNDPIITADNPGVALPDATINVVVRSDGSGATAQFTLWLLRQYPADYAKLCAVTGCDPQHATSFYPTQGLKNFVAQNGSQGVTTYSANNQFTINYDEYSYAQGIGFPVAQVKNAAGFYTLPTEHAVAVALTQASINQDKGSANYLSQDLSKVYGYKDPRTYPMSAYSYMIVPTQATNALNPAQGATLGFFANYALCEGQRPMGQLGYSPLPMNLVLAGMEQIRKIPGVDQDTIRKMDQTRDSVSGGSAPACNNPTFKPGDSPSANQLVRSAPFDKACDAACQVPWRGADAAVNQGPAGAPAAAGAEVPASTAEVTDLADAGAAAVDPASDAAACDPDSGTCTAVAAGAASGVAGQLTPVTTTLASSRGWGQPQNLLLIIGGLVGLLVLVPPLTAGALARRAGSKRGTKA